MGKYVNNMKKLWLWVLEGSSRHMYLPSHIEALGLGKILSSPHIGYGTWKNFELHPMYRLWPWDLEERSTSLGANRHMYSFFPIYSIPSSPSPPCRL